MKNIQHKPGLITRHAAVLVLLSLFAMVLSGCNYAEMRDDEAVQAYNQEFPKMPKNSIPIDGGIWVEREAIPANLTNPLAATPEIIAMGAERYTFYCIQCHGPKADGYGTVGQSFAPLPSNLKSPEIQALSDGELFYQIRFGFNRHPALYSTVTDDETWAVVRYIRKLANRT